jgi:hypothetical protein
VEQEELAGNWNRERKFGFSWIFLAFLVVCTAYTLMQLR